MSENRIFELIEKGTSGELAKLLENDPEQASARNDAGVSAVLYSCYMRKPEMTEYILTRGEPVLDACDAAAIGDIDRLSELIDTDPECVHQPGGDGFYPLHLACFFADTDTVSFLVAHGVDVTVSTGEPMRLRPLHSAAAVGNVEACRVLLERGADPNEAQQAGWTPLHAAANHGNLELTRLLLEHGAGATRKSDEGKTPLDLARDGGHAEVAALLTAE